MQTNLIERRKQKLEAQKNRIKQIESVLKSQERKARTRHLIELGGLIVKAGLDDFSANTLLGALLSLKDQANNENICESWTQTGGEAFQKDTFDKIPLTLHFKEKPTPETRDTLKNAGLKWNPLRNEWEGFVRADQVQNLEKLKGVTLKKLPQKKTQTKESMDPHLCLKLHVDAPHQKTQDAP